MLRNRTQNPTVEPNLSSCMYVCQWVHDPSDTRVSSGSWWCRHLTWRHHPVTACGLFKHDEGPGQALHCGLGLEDVGWCHRLRLEVVNRDRAATEVRQQTDCCCPPERRRLHDALTVCSALMWSLCTNGAPCSVVPWCLSFCFLCFYLTLYLNPSGEEASLPSLPYCHPAFGLTIFWLFILILGK